MSVEEEQQPPVLSNDTDNSQQPKKETPIPWDQLAPLLSVPLSEYISLDLILPFLYQMVDGFGIAKDPKDISFYSSLLFMSFSLCQVMTVMQWGRLSDRIGRRPVLMAGMTGSLISAILLGTAPSFWVALCARSFNGLMAGNVVVVKSMVSDISDNSNRPRIMAMLPLVWSLGSFFGSFMGGMLADPAHQYPSLFGNIQTFVKFPYLLPFLVGSVAIVLGLLFSMGWLKETLVKKNTNTENIPLLREPQPRQQKSVRELLTPTVAKIMFTNALTFLSVVMYDMTYPIFAATPTKDGGLGLDSRSIGISLVVAGVGAFYLQLVVYPRRDRKYGTLACYQHGLKTIILYLLSMPFLSILASRVQSQKHTGNVEFYLLWILLISLLLVRITGQVLSLTSLNLLLANVAPSRADLGAINGMQQLAISGTRVGGALVAGILWSWSIKHDLPYPFNYHLVWVFCAAVTSLSLYMTYQLPESINTFLADRERN